MTPGVKASDTMARDPIGELLAEWRFRAEILEDEGHHEDAERLRGRAQAVERARRDRRYQPLTIGRAAELSGYSPDRLRTLVREGTIPNAGESGSPHIRRCDLPRKPGRGSQLSASAGGREKAPVGSRTEMARSVVESE